MKTDLQIKREALIYTKESIARVLGVTVNRIGRMWVWAIGFWIWIKGRRPRLYKKSLFELDFVNFRRNGSKAYTVRYRNNYRPSNRGTLNEYQVTSKTDASKSYTVSSEVVGVTAVFKCECSDFAKMSEAYKAPACKHIYALLSYMGYQSLKEAVEATKKAQGDYRIRMVEEEEARQAREALGI